MASAAEGRTGNCAILERLREALCGSQQIDATEVPGLFNDLFMTRRGGGVILPTASQHAYFSAKFCNFSQTISDVSLRFCKKQRILTIFCDLPQFRQKSVKIAAKSDGSERKFSKIFQNHKKNREN